MVFKKYGSDSIKMLRDFASVGSFGFLMAGAILFGYFAIMGPSVHNIMEIGEMADEWSSSYLANFRRVMPGLVDPLWYNVQNMPIFVTLIYDNLNKKKCTSFYSKIMMISHINVIDPMTSRLRHVVDRRFARAEESHF